ncbi:uncharacterized protein Dana_GF14607 [Drosophila ananassae]|uniref:Uncharacterized protein n=1 Tax=Drosophila ananassae TaxID=7217 RepID=B3MJB2_DROAN|nr:uncharacterized protein LOC6497429 [Drosophila ananassae]EDV31322.2 uncharacterized protein Dana_GF14607 [Drosophila ananassae]
MTKANKTPQKSCEPNSNSPLTPVRYLDSPRHQSPTSHDANLATCRTRLESLVKQIQDNYAKWKLAQQRGTSICYTIEAKKTKSLENEKSTSYPDDLILPCNKLAIIASIFVDIANNTREILRQLRALCKMPGAAADTTFYKSWKLPQFVAFTNELSERYAQEAVIKKRVAENIAHSTDRSELISHTTFWEFPEHVDSYVQLGFLILAEEVSLK